MFDDGTHIEKLQNELHMLQLLGKNHHTSICENTTNIDDKKDSIDDNGENEVKVAMLIDAKTDVLLQTVDCIISNPREAKTMKIKVLLDPDSQKTHLSDAVKNYLKLDAITKQLPSKPLEAQMGNRKSWVILNLL